MQIREASLDLTRILAYHPAIPFDLTSREIATGNRAIAFRTDWIIYREFEMLVAFPKPFPGLGTCTIGIQKYAKVRMIFHV